MKPLFVQIAFMAISFHLQAQITMTPVAPEKETEIAPYDSLVNFLGIDYNKYIGQELYLIPKAESLREYGYRDLVKSPSGPTSGKTNVYECCDSYNTKYESVEGKYFIVEDVHEDSKSKYSPYRYLKLKRKDNNDEVYFKYNPESKHSFPFLVVGFFEKQKSLLVGKEILLRPFPEIEGLNQKKAIDINSGEEVNLTSREYYECIELTIDMKYYEPALVLRGSEEQTFMFALGNRFLDKKRIFTKEEAEYYTAKFGEENWSKVLDEVVVIGFTEEMARMSWGEPKKINRSSSGDQWVYDGQYIYFENGKMRGFN
jgi:hypothetical protein